MNYLGRFAFLLFALFALTASAQDQASESKSEDSFAYGEYNSLIQAANWSEAGAMLDAGLKESPNSPKLLSLSLQLANRTMQAAPEAAEKRLISLVEHYLGSSSISTAAARDLVQATDFLSSVVCWNGSNQPSSAARQGCLAGLLGRLVWSLHRHLPASEGMEPHLWGQRLRDPWNDV
jgi:predicted Zn-dependent protease